uniref:Uncharacterized protein n=1 Tax=Oncorhynchus kisutch TaxID=8019 RepID=A0A8C7D465_ONCKI
MECRLFNSYKQNPEMFKQTARLWSQVYAVIGPHNAVIVALSSKSWDVETATEQLLSN